ncbi:hypothetical protein COOONC_01018 [Cooperia oncophora]
MKSEKPNFNGRKKVIGEDFVRSDAVRFFRGKNETLSSRSGQDLRVIMSNVDPKLVRQEIDELLTSGRLVSLERLETVSAHIFQMFGREWRELTSSEVFIHVFHDSFDDVDKLLARDRYKLVFDFIPLSASFTFTCLSRKFVRLSLNKFERTAPAYGFGFSNLREMETFCAHLDRIRSYAKATLVPPVRSIVLGMGNIGLQSPSSTPPRVNIPYFYADNTVTDIPSTLSTICPAMTAFRMNMVARSQQP